jgi:predicted TIM-barrel fold metal-dependent hydrolase
MWLSSEASGVPPADFSVLFAHYADSDLASAGLSADDAKKLFGYETGLDEKWKILEPIYARCRHTGYLRNVRESLRLMFGIDDITSKNYRDVAERIRAQVQPGYYKRLLKDVAKLDYCQVNALEGTVFRETHQPELLAQDISTVSLATTALNVPRGSRTSGITVKNIDDWHKVIDWCFANYGPRAVATKNQSAYSRRLDYADVSAETVAPAFARYVEDPKSVSPEEFKSIQDHLWHYCIDKAVEYKLPVKLHTGYYAGHGTMRLERPKENMSDLCEPLIKHPDAKFVLMHIDYPYQDEAIAMAKHFPQVYIDMCWAWIINPAASVRFVKEYLMAAPANKLLTFGGDYRWVEMVPGHAAIARKGLAQALTELVESGWLDAEETPELIERLMRGNAHELFNYEEKLKNWSAPAAAAVSK